MKGMRFPYGRKPASLLWREVVGVVVDIQASLLRKRADVYGK